jgi:hypothetical protein
VDAEGRLQTVGEFTGTVEVPNIDVLLSTRASEVTLSSVLAQLDITLSALRDALRGANTKDFSTLEADVESVRTQLDVLLSTRASEFTLSSILAQLDISLSTLRDAITAAAPNSKTLADLYERLDSIRTQLDVALSTRLSESAFTGRWDGGIYGFDGATARKIRTDSDGHLQIDVLTLANPSNLDVALSTRASESTLSSILTQLDITLSALRDALLAGTITYPGGLDDIYNKLNAQLDITISALRDALKGVSAKDFTTLEADVESIYSRLDVALSTRASETTLDDFSDKFPSAVVLGDSLSNPTTTLIGASLLGFDGSLWRRVRVNASGYLLCVLG